MKLTESLQKCAYSINPKQDTKNLRLTLRSLKKDDKICDEIREFLEEHLEPTNNLINSLSKYLDKVKTRDDELLKDVINDFSKVLTFKHR